MIKAIIFDLDDTLYDETQFVEGGFKAVSIYIADNYGIDERIIFQTLVDVLKEYGRGKTFDIALKKLGIYDENVIPMLVNVYRTHVPQLSLYAEAKKLLLHLKSQGYLLGLITDGNLEVQKNKVKSLKIDNLFNCMIFSDEYSGEKQKPHPFPYEQALYVLKAHPKESVYIGDNPYKDFITAKKIGMHTIRVLKGRYKEIRLKKEYEAEHQIKNIKELPSILCLINK